MSGLTARAARIIGMLISTEGYLSLGKIAEELEVSSRTIIREMKGIEELLAPRGVKVNSRPSQGLKLEGEPSALAALRQELLQADTPLELSPRDRQAYLMAELLNASEPLKLYYFTAALKVSEGTISNDLDKIEPVLAGWNLRLIRKPGYGIEVEGDEKNIRSAISHLIFEHFSRGDLLGIIRRKYQGVAPRPVLSKVRNRLLNTIGDEILDGIEEAIGRTEAMKRYPVADNSYVGLVVHMALAVKRLMNGERITFDPLILEELREYPEYDIARAIVIETGIIFGITIPEDETGYITMHLKGVKYGNTFKGNGKIHVNDYRIVHLADELIRRVQQETGYYLEDNNRLLTGLVNHLGPALSRIQMGLEIKNPLLEEIRVRYRTYYDLTARNVQLLEERLGIVVPEDEIGYLAMHFGAAIEEMSRKVLRVFRVVIVCSTGIGSSKLLEARIAKHYNNLRILESRSVMDLNAFLKERRDVDFVISTVGVQGVDRPVAVVSPLLLEQDMERINRIMGELASAMPFSSSRLNGDEELLPAIEALGDMTTSTLAILKGFSYHQLTVEDKGDLIQQLSMHLVDETMQEAVIQALIGREQAGSTVFDGGKGLLLHGRVLGLVIPVLAVSSVSVSQPPADLPTGIRYVVVMLAPDKIGEALRSVFGEISRNLAENPLWTSTLQQGSGIEIRRQLERLLGQMLKKQADQLEI